jgi:hypothetical protein
MLRRCTHYFYASRRSITLSLGVLRRLGGSTRFDLLVEQFDTRELGSTDCHEEPFFAGDLTKNRRKLLVQIIRDSPTSGNAREREGTRGY